MIKSMLKLGLLSVLALAAVGTPISLRAEESTATNSAATNKPIINPFYGKLPFNGKLRAVNISAQTITIRSTTLAITSETTITKDGKPATLADAVVGEDVSGQFKRTEDGKIQAVVVNFGKKKAAAPASTTKTNTP